MNMQDINQFLYAALQPLNAVYVLPHDELKGDTPPVSLLFEYSPRALSNLFISFLSTITAISKPHSWLKS